MWAIIYCDHKSNGKKPKNLVRSEKYVFALNVTSFGPKNSKKKKTEKLLKSRIPSAHQINAIMKLFHTHSIHNHRLNNNTLVRCVFFCFFLLFVRSLIKFYNRLVRLAHIEAKDLFYLHKQFGFNDITNIINDSPFIFHTRSVSWQAVMLNSVNYC